MDQGTAGKKPLKDRTSHSNFRRGMTDYHDGDNVTHYLGNDDYLEGSNVPFPSEREKHKFSGEVAEGNQMFESSNDEAETEDESLGGEDFDYE